MQKLKIAAFWSATGRGLHAMTAFLSPAAFEQRHRDRQRRALVAELDGLDEQARYDRARRPVLTDALQVLSREDMAATLRPLRYHSARVLRAMDQRPGELTTLSDSALERLRKDLQAAEVPLGVKVDRLRACIPPKETS